VPEIPAPAETGVQRYRKRPIGVQLPGRSMATVVAEDVADAILDQLPQAARTFTEYAVAWGDDDPNGDDARADVCDDEEDAADHVQWRQPGAYVARRTVTRSRWERVPEEPPADATAAPEGRSDPGPVAEDTGTLSVDYSAAQEGSP
jgi:hypothetical protein